MKNHSFARNILAVSFSMVIAGCASADYGHKRHNSHYGYADSYSDYGRVVNARPIYRQVAIEVPRESCRIQTMVREDRRHTGDSFAGTVVGGLVGAAIGHELGNGRGSATAVGGLIGATLGNDASSKRSLSYRDQEVCSTHYRTEYEQRIVAYDVSYSYQGRIYKTRTNRHPGDRIVLAVAANPQRY